MKLTLIRLGPVSVVTKDYSGNFAWDDPVYEFFRRVPIA